MILNWEAVQKFIYFEGFGLVVSWHHFSLLLFKTENLTMRKSYKNFWQFFFSHFNFGVSVWSWIITFSFDLSSIIIWIVAIRRLIYFFIEVFTFLFYSSFIWKFKKKAKVCSHPSNEKTISNFHTRSINRLVSIKK